MLNDSSVSANATYLNSFVPQSLGIFTWRAVRNRILVRLELDKRGVDLESVRCPVCDNALESVSHAMLDYNLAKEVWDCVHLWWGAAPGLNDFSIHTIFDIEHGNPRSNDGHKTWQATKWVCGYLIWKNRNQQVFQNKCKTALDILSEI
ncbi:uncharacterized protein [Rutidosis leptorrhynchoides]|uniref:uncharacterized protein n=1 Tax=Rutidosis leptorrhynchoides TaxID=125765 RepID=UPI003A9997C1